MLAFGVNKYFQHFWPRSRFSPQSIALTVVGNRWLVVGYRVPEVPLYARYCCSSQSRSARSVVLTRT